MLKNHNIIQVPRVDKEGLVLDDEKPVVIRYPELVGTTKGWRDLGFLRDQFGDTPVTVMASPTKEFKYYDEKKNRGNYPYQLTATRTTMTFAQFEQKLNTNNNTAPNNSNNEGNNTNKTYYYMQHPFGGLTPKKLDIFGVKESMEKDIRAFEWDWLNAQVRGHQQIFDQVHPVLGFMIWVGDSGCVTPTHFDQQHVFLTQVKGYKKIYLFSPSQFCHMYPFPMRHVYDRQAQVDIVTPDLTRFPAFADATVYEAVIGPGELLFLPAFWWHYVESTGGEEDDVTISVRFSCYRAEKKGNNWPNKILAMRTVERVVAEILGESQAIHFFSCFEENIETTFVPEKRKGVKTKKKEWTRDELLAEIAKCLVEAEITETTEDFLLNMVRGRFNFESEKIP